MATPCANVRYAIVKNTAHGHDAIFCKKVTSAEKVKDVFVSALLRHVPKLGFELPEVLHVTQALQDTIQKKKLKLKTPSKTVRVTYHDPCHLSRAAGVYDDPREILRAIPGLDLIEMETTRDAAMCCGAGGGLRSYDSDLSMKMAADRVKGALAIEAEIIATACPFCENNLVAGAEMIDSKIRVVDVVDLLAESL